MLSYFRCMEMRRTQIVLVADVLRFFPHRKKSWAYVQIRYLKDVSGRRFVTWGDWDSFGLGGVPLVGSAQAEK